jgi:phenylalanyl-tRNA synthetase beta chain
MTVSYNWLQALLPVSLSLNEMSEILTSVGLEVEGTEEQSTIKGGLKDLVVGQIISAEKHPNADKLQVCMVDVGNDTINKIVCGAPNARAGLKVIVALPNTTIYPTVGEPFTIKKGKIRGEESLGMICGEDEIGLGTCHDGIVELPTEWLAGSLVSQCYNLPEADYSIEIGLTPNRMDSMSHIGIAKDICAYLSNRDNQPYSVNKPQINWQENNTTSPAIKININDAKRCLRYAGISINQIKVAPSPEWMQLQLKTIGVKPINNVVDITNYVLHEMGQPLHAFDAQAITGSAINVQCAEANSTFVTLDGTERKMLATDLMICNANEAMCIGGCIWWAKKWRNRSHNFFVFGKCLL